MPLTRREKIVLVIAAILMAAYGFWRGPGGI